MEAKKQPADLQKNLNTFLLTICIGLISWVLLEVNHLDSQMAVQEMSGSNLRDAIRSMNEVDNDHSKALQDLNNRLIKLEMLRQKQ